MSKLFVFVLSLVLAGCSTAQLRPAPTAQLSSADKNAAVAKDSGVRMVVAADAWSADPYSLEDELTPLHVTIENNTEAPLRIRYEDFKLISTSGFTYSALPPLKIDGAVSTPPAYVSRFGYHGFYPSSLYARFYTGLHPWAQPWTYDPFYYDRHYPAWRIPLPIRRRNTSSAITARLHSRTSDGEIGRAMTRILTVGTKGSDFSDFNQRLT